MGNCCSNDNADGQGNFDIHQSELSKRIANLSFNELALLIKI